MPAYNENKKTTHRDEAFLDGIPIVKSWPLFIVVYSSLSIFVLPPQNGSAYRASGLPDE